ncbi:MAG: hypothetical protein JXR70_07520 [Spirochaetales bacterium]|nr:hypothetical protein [Spirochaetales bacterium]
MKKMIVLSIAFFVFLTLVSCQSYWAMQSAQSFYNQGAYVQSAMEAISAINYDRGNKEAIALLERVYPLAVKQSLDLIWQLENGSAAFSHSRIADTYEALENLRFRLEALDFWTLQVEKRPITLDAQNFSAELVVAKEKAAEEYYQAGLEKLSGTARSDKKQAYSYFILAMNYVPGYRDAAQKAELSKNAAMDYLLVLPTENRAGDFYSNTSGILSDRFLAELSKGVVQKSFTKVVDRSQMRRILLEQEMSLSALVDESTSLRVGQLSGATLMLSSRVQQIKYSEPKISQKQEKLEGSIELSPEDPDYVDYAESQYIKDLSGDIIYFSREASFQVTGSFRLINLETAELIASDVVEAEAQTSAKWAVYSGDPELLSNYQKALLKADSKLTPYETLLNEAVSEWSQKASSRVLNWLD